MYDNYRQFPETQFFPGFPFPPTPGPTPGPRDLERRVSQLERIVQRQGREIEQLNRRLRRLERPIGHGYGGPQY
ncbi:hypothetical protein RJD24_16915 [Bacillaceae bacterium IKA-2]|nr:hypothetical protein RJD24_16915 [Bacillaceae bacterium IKA-2]